MEHYQVDVVIHVLRRLGGRAPRRKLMKLLFLIDRELHIRYGEAAFRWRWYKYGPFSRDLLSVLDAMELYGSVRSWAEEGDIIYELTTTASPELPQEAREIIDKIIDEWGRRSIDELAEYVNTFITPGKPPI